MMRWLACATLLGTIATASRADADEPKFTADPVTDGAILALSTGFGVTAEAMIAAGKIKPQQINPNFQTSDLPTIDRFVLSEHVDPNAANFSSIGVAAAIGFAVLHPIASGITRGRDAFLVDAVIYAESLSITFGLTDITKLAVRRPRPIAYIQRNQAIASGGDPNTYEDPSVDHTLSFFSGHTAECATVTATASYLMFTRYPHDARPWITLGVGSALTTFVAVERIRSANHFPTDTIAGASVGAAVGLLVAHLHRENAFPKRPIWVGFTPSFEGAGGTLTFGGLL